MAKKQATKKQEEPKEEEVVNTLEDSDDALPQNLSEDVENPSMEKDGDVEVGDPQDLRPVELPLVVKPKKEWENEEQAAYARTLNAYAYRNPDKWREKKDVLIKRLKEIGKNPKAFYEYASRDSSLSYNNQLING